MKATPHLIIAAIAVLIALSLTVGVLVGNAGSLAVPTTALRLPVPGSNVVLPPERVLNPLIESLAMSPNRNPFTLAERSITVNLPVNLPPAPQLDLPLPTALPLVER